MPEQWSFGETVVRRELLHGHPWIGFSTYVVEDTDQLLAVYLAEGSRLGFPDWPFEEWVHCPGRDFAGWYVNLQEPIVRHERGFDTLDHELDFWLHPDGTWSAKDPGPVRAAGGPLLGRAGVGDSSNGPAGG